MMYRQTGEQSPAMVVVLGTAGGVVDKIAVGEHNSLAGAGSPRRKEYCRKVVGCHIARGCLSRVFRRDISEIQHTLRRLAQVDIILYLRAALLEQRDIPDVLFVKENRLTVGAEKLVRNIFGIVVGVQRYRYITAALYSEPRAQILERGSAYKRDMRLFREMLLYPHGDIVTSGTKLVKARIAELLVDILRKEYLTAVKLVSVVNELL